VELQSLVTQRKDIAKEMVMDPSNSDLMDKMEACQRKINEAGLTDNEIALMESKEMQSAVKKRKQEDMDAPAWTRPDMFIGLPSVKSIVGLSILKKLGWTCGQVLGRGCPYGCAFGIGSITPVEFEIKTDQAGLATLEERTAIKAKKFENMLPTVTTGEQPAPRQPIDGRHPVAALADYCHKNKIKQPDYVLLKEEGEAHKKLYTYQVTIKGGKFSCPTGARNKRKAKSDVASMCLEKLGLMTSAPIGYS